MNSGLAVLKKFLLSPWAKQLCSSGLHSDMLENSFVCWIEPGNWYSVKTQRPSLPSPFSCLGNVIFNPYWAGWHAEMLWPLRRWGVELERLRLAEALRLSQVPREGSRCLLLHPLTSTPCHVKPIASWINIIEKKPSPQTKTPNKPKSTAFFFPLQLQKGVNFSKYSIKKTFYRVIWV